MRIRITLVSGLLALLGLAPAAHAAANLIVNGDFETTTMTAPTQIGYATTTNGVTNNNTVTGWTVANGAYDFLFFTNNNTATGQYGSVSLYTSTNGGTGGNATLNSPTGGNFVAADGAFQVGAISQTVTGLSVGTNYQLTFWWAAGQQAGFTGATTESWSVSLGTQTFNTQTVTTPSQGFTPWRQVSMVFNATSTSEVLSFLAAGTPSGQPPFSLLDGVSLVAAPEPADWVVMVAGLTAMCGAGLFTRRRHAATARLRPSL